MDLYIYDVIGEDLWGDGVTAKRVRDELAAAGRDEPVTVRINSPGGDVFEAVAIEELLARHKGPVDATIDGLAASAATYIAAGIDRVTMARGGMYMIHNPWTLAMGEAGDLRARADLLEKITDNIAEAYARKSTLDAAAVRGAMDEETWYAADEALEAGFVDAVSGAEAKNCQVPAVLAYKNRPAAGPAEKPAKQATRAALRRQLAKARRGAR